MTVKEISYIRLLSQQIAGTEYKTAKEIVGWMGAMQAQDYPMAKLAIGLRMLNSTDTKVEEAFNKGEIIRTHVMRPTWHFVSADDIHWMLKLTALRIKSSLKSRHKQLELSDDVLRKSNSIIEKALSTEKFLTRDELAAEFAKANIKTSENRLSHLMFSAELEGLVCSGPVKAKKQTYALLQERVPVTKTLTKDESLAELAKRYFTSHCPATLQDFVWWSGLSLTEARRALELIKSDFISETIGTEIYWLTNSFSTGKYDESSVHLLPAYDEFLISYRNRSASLSLVDNRKTVSENGLFRPVVVIDGQVSGLWKRTLGKNQVIIDTNFFQPQEKDTHNKIIEKADKFESFFGKKTLINLVQ